MSVPGVGGPPRQASDGTILAAQAGGRFKCKTDKVPTDNREPGSISVGSDGNLWFIEGAPVIMPNPDRDAGGTFHSNIGQIAPSGDTTEFRVACDYFPHDIVRGPLLYRTAQ